MIVNYNKYFTLFSIIFAYILQFLLFLYLKISPTLFGNEHNESKFGYPKELISALTEQKLNANEIR